MKKYIKYGLFIFLEFCLLVLVINLSVKIWYQIKSKILAIQYPVRIDKSGITMSSGSGKLKYFYEPKANSVRIFNPSWLGYEVKNKINKDSINSETDYSINKPGKTYRIMTIGDSFTYGIYVNVNENWPSILEEKMNQLKCNGLDKFEVINLGVEGYDIEYTINRFYLRGIKYNPDLVVWLLSDWSFDKINELITPIKNDLNDKDLPDVDTVRKIYQKTTIAKEQIYSKFGFQSIIDYQKNLLLDFSNRYKGKVLLISFSDFSRESGQYKDIINKIINQNANYFYFDNLFNPKLDSNYHFIDTHPNKEGHIKMAEDIFNYFIGSKLLDCSIK